MELPQRPPQPGDKPTSPALRQTNIILLTGGTEDQHQFREIPGKYGLNQITRTSDKHKLGIWKIIGLDVSKKVSVVKATNQC